MASDYDAIRRATTDTMGVLAILNACVVRGGDRAVIERVWIRFVQRWEKERQDSDLQGK